MSLVLRHQPEKIGLNLDENGWASVDELISKVKANGLPLDRELLEAVVRDNDKQRFTFSEDGDRIRANQGHSLSVNLNLESRKPPKILYHGTAIRFLDSIKEDGLDKRARQHVHLSDNLDTAAKVGARHGKAVILGVRALEMKEKGHTFFKSKNGVWLTDSVPVEFLIFPGE